MKRIEECDLCWKKVDWVKTCIGCGHTVRIDCFMAERFMCPVCGGNFHQLIQNKMRLCIYWVQKLVTLEN